VFIIIRKDAKLSQKTHFIVKLLSQNSSNKIFYVFKIESEKFEEKWYNDRVQLPSSIRGIIMCYLLTPLRSPEEFRKGVVRRLSITKPKYILAGSGFLTMLRHTLHLYFCTSAQASRLLRVLNKLNSPKIFLVDEFISLNLLDLKKLRTLGSIIYVSQDIAHNHFDFVDNLITKKLMLRLERDAIDYMDLVVACSDMERLKYLEMGARNAIFYPNIYPTNEFEPCEKDEMPSISIVLRGHWGFKA